MIFSVTNVLCGFHNTLSMDALHGFHNVMVSWVLCRIFRMSWTLRVVSTLMSLTLFLCCHDVSAVRVFQNFAL